MYLRTQALEWEFRNGTQGPSTDLETLKKASCHKFATLGLFSRAGVKKCEMRRSYYKNDKFRVSYLLS